MLRSRLPIVALALAAACRGDVTSTDTADAPSLDSALARDVMLAAYEPAFDSAAEDTTEPTPPATVKVLDPVVQPVAPQVAVMRAPQSKSTTTRQARPAVSPSPRARAAVVPVGTELAVLSGRRICVTTSKVGDRFNARLVRAVRSSGRVPLPQGAHVTGEITSLTGPLGEEDIHITLRSVTIGGKSYRVRSRITDIQLDRKPGADRCIPDDGRITARLTQPLSIAG